MAYYIDQQVKCQGTFTDSDGAVTDPTAVFFQFLEPGAAIVSYEYGTDAELVKDSTGVYYVLLDADTVGRWLFRFYSTGTGQAAAEDGFDVETLTTWS